jgi:putative ABC transport system permease protein
MKNMLSANVFQVQRYEQRMGIHFDNERRIRRPEIKAEYADAIRERCPSVRSVGVESWHWGEKITLGGLETNQNQSVAGGSIEFAANNALVIVRGRAITEQEEISGRRVIVLGAEAVNALFGGLDPVGEYVHVGTSQFEVIGTFEERGALLGESQDRYHWIPLSTFFRIYGKQSVNLTVQSWSSDDFESAQQEVIECMRVERGLKPGQPNNFAMFNADMVQASFNDMTSWIGYAAFGICGISLLVAGIGIMNIMLVSVTERTREIGLRKALGGTRSSILRQFIIEAVMLSEVGGAIGILVGYSIAIAVNNMLHFPAPVPVWAVILSVIFCSVVGLGFGIGPAVKAARLDPIEALRYE